MCRRPYMGNAGRTPFGCGQCMPCRINSRRLWQTRMMLESYSHEASCFVTLTYSDENLPEGGSLVPRDVQLFIKRLRFAFGEQRLRYYVCGEYGDVTWRPHYHAILFGISPIEVARVGKAWGLGFVHVGEFNIVTAGYTCGYLTKRLTKKDDPVLNGRYPEFSRKSLRPGLGAGALAVVALALDNDVGDDEISRLGDAPGIIRIEGRKRQLGRYLKARLRMELGLTDEFVNEAKAKITFEQTQRLSHLLADAFSRGESDATARSVFVEENLGRILQLEAREKLGKRRTL